MYPWKFMKISLLLIFRSYSLRGWLVGIKLIAVLFSHSPIPINHFHFNFHPSSPKHIHYRMMRQFVMGKKRKIYCSFTLHKSKRTSLFFIFHFIFTVTSQFISLGFVQKLKRYAIILTEKNTTKQIVQIMQHKQCFSHF